VGRGVRLAISGPQETQNNPTQLFSVDEERAVIGDVGLEANTSLPRRSAGPDVCSIQRQEALFGQVPHKMALSSLTKIDSPPDRLLSWNGRVRGANRRI
jgi:hypothetical protein